MTEAVYVGVDVGASRTKVAILDGDRRLVGHAVMTLGNRFRGRGRSLPGTALQMAGRSRSEVADCFSTGYGRKNVRLQPGDPRPRSAATPGAAITTSRMAMTIIDIGGQDNKIIKLDAQGQRLRFQDEPQVRGRDRRVSRGNVPRGWTSPWRTWTVWPGHRARWWNWAATARCLAGTEVLEKIRQGKQVADIVKGPLFLGHQTGAGDGRSRPTGWS